MSTAVVPSSASAKTAASMNDPKIDSLVRDARSFGIRLSDEYVSALKEESDTESDENAHSMNSEAFRTFLLNSDFRKKPFVDPFFPENVGNIGQGELRGPIVLQVVSITDVSLPARLQQTRKVDLHRKNRILVAVLTDGHSKVTFVEKDYCSALHADIPPGDKMLFVGGEIRVGKVLLTASSLRHLPGGVDHMKETWLANKIALRTKHIVGPSTDSTNASKAAPTSNVGPPKFQLVLQTPLQKSAAIVTVADVVAVARKKAENGKDGNNSSRSTANDKGRDRNNRSNTDRVRPKDNNNSNNNNSNIGTNQQAMPPPPPTDTTAAATAVPARIDMNGGKPNKHSGKDHQKKDANAISAKVDAHNGKAGSDKSATAKTSQQQFHNREQRDSHEHSNGDSRREQRGNDKLQLPPPPPRDSGKGRGDAASRRGPRDRYNTQAHENSCVGVQDMAFDFPELTISDQGKDKPSSWKDQSITMIGRATDAPTVAVVAGPANSASSNQRRVLADGANRLIASSLGMKSLSAAEIVASGPVNTDGTSNSKLPNRNQRTQRGIRETATTTTAIATEAGRPASGEPGGYSLVDFIKPSTGGGGSRSGGGGAGSKQWACSACTFSNHSSLKLCEMCGTKK